MWLAEQVELLASSIYPPRSPAVASHTTVTMLTTLLLAPQRADQQPPLDAGLSVAAATVSAVGAEKNGTLPTNGKVPGGLVEVHK